MEAPLLATLRTLGPDQLRAFWNALPDTDNLYWRSELTGIDAEASGVRRAEQDLEAARVMLREACEDLAHRMWRTALREWPEHQVQDALRTIVQKSAAAGTALPPRQITPTV